MTENDKQAVSDAVFLLTTMHAAFNADVPGSYKLGILFLAFCHVVFKGRGAIPASKIAEYCNITLDEAEYVINNVDSLTELLQGAAEAIDDKEEEEAFLRAMKGIAGGEA